MILSIYVFQSGMMDLLYALQFFVLDLLLIAIKSISLFKFSGQSVWGYRGTQEIILYFVVCVNNVEYYFWLLIK